MNKFWFWTNFFLVLVLILVSYFSGEFFISILVVFFIVYFFAYFVYLIINGFSQFSKGNNVFVTMLWVPALTLVLLMLYVFLIIHIYIGMDNLAVKEFANGNFCSGILSCSDGDRRIKINKPIEKNYRKVVENGCIIVRSPSYALIKLHYRMTSESCGGK